MAQDSIDSRNSDNLQEQCASPASSETQTQSAPSPAAAHELSRPSPTAMFHQMQPCIGRRGKGRRQVICSTCGSTAGGQAEVQRTFLHTGRSAGTVPSAHQQVDQHGQREDSVQQQQLAGRHSGGQNLQTEKVWGQCVDSWGSVAQNLMKTEVAGRSFVAAWC